MKYKLIRSLKRFGATTGVSVSIIGIACITGAMANGYLHPKSFIGYIIALVVVGLISIGYIDLHTEGGEWI